MPISFRTYAVIAVVFGVLIYVLALLLGDDIAAWAVERQVEASIKGQPIFERVVFGTIEFLMDRDTRLFGAIAGGLLWPFVLILLFLTVMALIILEFIDANQEIEAVRLLVGYRLL